VRLVFCGSQTEWGGDVGESAPGERKGDDKSRQSEFMGATSGASGPRSVSGRRRCGQRRVGRSALMVALECINSGVKETNKSGLAEDRWGSEDNRGFDGSHGDDLPFLFKSTLGSLRHSHGSLEFSRVDRMRFFRFGSVFGLARKSGGGGPMTPPVFFPGASKDEKKGPPLMSLSNASIQG